MSSNLDNIKVEKVRFGASLRVRTVRIPSISGVARGGGAYTINRIPSIRGEKPEGGGP